MKSDRSKHVYGTCRPRHGGIVEVRWKEVALWMGVLWIGEPCTVELWTVKAWSVVLCTGEAWMGEVWTYIVEPSTRELVGANSLSGRRWSGWLLPENMEKMK